MTEVSNRSESRIEQSAQNPNIVDSFNEFRLSSPTANSSLSRAQKLESETSSLKNGCLVIPPLFASSTEAEARFAGLEHSNLPTADRSNLKMPEAYHVSTAEAPPAVEVEKITPEYLKSIDGKNVFNKYETWALHYKIEAQLKEQKDGTATSTTPDGCTITRNKDNSIEIKEKDGSTRIFQNAPDWKVIFRDKNGKEVVYDKLAENTKDPEQPILLNRLRDGGTSEYKFPDGSTVTIKNKFGSKGGFVFKTAKGVEVETFGNNTVQYSKAKDVDD